MFLYCSEVNCLTQSETLTKKKKGILKPASLEGLGILDKIKLAESDAYSLIFVKQIEPKGRGYTGGMVFFLEFMSESCIY